MAPLKALATGIGLTIATTLPAIAAPPPQWLQATAQWCLPQTSPAACIALEVAGSPQQQSWGLQRRGPLPSLRGMWFPYSTPTPARFWMHLTPEPLDMVFIRNQQVIAVVPQAQPCMRLPCRSYGPGVPVDGVVELAGGEAARLGITVGTAAVVLPLVTPLPALRR